MEIHYRYDRVPTTDQVIELYRDAGLSRPINDEDRIEQMINNSNLFVSAWHGDLLVGLARSVTDWRWCCYLSDLAVRSAYKNKGIGRQVVKLTKEKVGDQCMVLLLSVPSAMEYYPRIGFQKCENSFIIQRKL